MNEASFPVREQVLALFGEKARIRVAVFVTSSH
jgi:hypothetical protein